MENVKEMKGGFEVVREQTITLSAWQRQCLRDLLEGQFDEDLSGKNLARKSALGNIWELTHIETTSQCEVEFDEDGNEKADLKSELELLQWMQAFYPHSYFGVRSQTQ